MPIKIPRGYEVTRPAFLEISQGERPALDSLYPADWLPGLFIDTRHNEYITIRAGTILSRQLTAGALFVVPANGGAAQAVTYTAADVARVCDIGNYPNFVAAAVARAGALVANKPIGWAFHHMYDRAMVRRVANYLLPHDAIATLNDYVIEIPCLTTEQDTFGVGDLVEPDANGRPQPWVGAAVTDVEQICGRCLELIPITSGTSSPDRLDLVRTVVGSGVSGSSTAGVPAHLRVTHLTTGSYATNKVRISITLL